MLTYTLYPLSNPVWPGVVFEIAVQKCDFFFIHGRKTCHKCAFPLCVVLWAQPVGGYVRVASLSPVFTSREKNIYFFDVKNFPQKKENTSEIIQNMSDIFQNISDIFFATYTPADFQVLGG